MDLKIQEIRRLHEEKILKMANVVGVMTGYKIKNGEKTDEMSIICLVEKKIREEELKKRDLIPK